MMRHNGCTPRKPANRKYQVDLDVNSPILIPLTHIHLLTFHRYVLQPQMLAPTSALDPSLHYVNLANQMQGLQLGNPAVSGYLSPQQWPVWPTGIGAKHSNSSQQGTNHGGNHSGYNDAD